MRTLLHRNLPDGSKLLYHHDWVPCPDGKRFAACPGAFATNHANEVTSTSDLKAAEQFENDDGVVEAVHLHERDIGTLLAAADSEGNYPACVMPPPAPPPPAPVDPRGRRPWSRTTPGSPMARLLAWLSARRSVASCSSVSLR